jgi:hypothetical protein
MLKIVYSRAMARNCFDTSSISDAVHAVSRSVSLKRESLSFVSGSASRIPMTIPVQPQWRFSSSTRWGVEKNTCYASVLNIGFSWFVK